MDENIDKLIKVFTGPYGYGSSGQFSSFVPPKGFAQVAKLWQEGKISGRDAAETLQITQNQFYYLITKQGIFKTKRLAGCIKQQPPTTFLRIFKAWKRHKMSAKEAAKSLGVSITTFYAWASAQPATLKDRKRYFRAYSRNFHIYNQWKSREITTTEAAKAVGISERRFVFLIKQYDPAHSRRQGHEINPNYAQFPKYYRQVVLKKMKAKDAAAELGISPALFSYWTRRYLSERADLS
jgi:predicted DNA-binding protein (UPF0251 family)